MSWAPLVPSFLSVFPLCPSYCSLLSLSSGCSSIHSSQRRSFLFPDSIGLSISPSLPLLPFLPLFYLLQPTEQAATKIICLFFDKNTGAHLLLSQLRCLVLVIRTWVLIWTFSLLTFLMWSSVNGSPWQLFTDFFQHDLGGGKTSPNWLSRSLIFPQTAP